MNDYYGYRRCTQQHKVDKVWGWELWIKNCSKYCGKLLHINSGKSTSFHYHAVKEETLYLQNGLLRIYYGDGDDFDKVTVQYMSPGDSFHIRVGLRHKLEAFTEEGCDVFEFSTEHKDEDSIRINK